MSAAATERFDTVFTAALRGAPCRVVGLHSTTVSLPVARWLRLSDGDRALLAYCRGATLDVGCGPGRMTAHLADRGHRTLGIDIVAGAVAEARRRGVWALHRDVFQPLPREGTWNTALLADGNIGIGGDPAVLLRRLGQIVEPAGRIVCDLSEPGTGLLTRTAHLECSGLRSPAFPWSLVDPEALVPLANAAGLTVAESGRSAGRWYAVLRPSGAALTA